MEDWQKELKNKTLTPSYDTLNTQQQVASGSILFGLGLLLGNSWNWFLWMALVIIIIGSLTSIIIYSDMAQEIKKAKRNAINALSQSGDSMEA